MASELKVARVRADKTQDMVAEALGVTRVTVSLWERGKRDIPPARAKQLSELLSIDLHQILPGAKQ